MGNRILKKLLDVDTQKTTKTFYTRDAQGNVLSIYENGKQKVYQDGNGNKYYFNDRNELVNINEQNVTGLGLKGKLIFEGHRIFVCIDKIDGIYDNCANSRVELTDITDENLITQTEVPIYGSDRIGTYNPPSETNINSDIYILNRSYKRYELKDHLGNVRVTVSDSKRVSFVSETLVFSADIKTYTDYYAFGMEMVGRNWSEGEAYRFGHNRQEKSKEVGEDNYTAEFWEYDSQVIRRFNTDPIVKEYESPYLAFGGNPIWFSDVNGDDASNGEDPPADGKKGDKFLWDGVPFIHDGKDWINESSKDLPDCIIRGRKMTRTESFMESYYERKRQDGEWLYTNITRPIIEYTPVVSGAVNSYESYQRGDGFGVGLGIFSSTFDVFGGKLISAGFGLLQKRSSRLFTNAMSDASGVVDDIPFIERVGNTIRIGNDEATMNNFALMIKTPSDGSFNVLLHGHDKGNYFTPNRQTPMYAKELAEILYSNGYQQGTPINLISCFSGMGGWMKKRDGEFTYMGVGAAYQLFRYTKASFLQAPTHKIATLDDGGYVIKNQGLWKNFKK